MIRSLVYRNVLSATLFVVAIAGLIVKINEVHHGIIDATTRFTLRARCHDESRRSATRQAMPADVSCSRSLSD